VKSTIIILISLISLQSFAIMSGESMLWIMQQSNVQESLKGQSIIKMYEKPQLCRAAFCFDFYICGTRSYLGEPSATQYVITKLRGREIFFKQPLHVTSKVYTEMPGACR
jgi:hypothetical protein